MKKYLLLLMITLGVGSLTYAQNTPAPNKVETASETISGPVMAFESLVVDYGTIEKDAEPLRVASFTNTGTEPLVIKNARGSCGCTVPTWPREPIMPGESANIEIRYATNRVGKFSKKVTLTTNQGGDPIVLTVKGNVLKDKESVPAAKPNIIEGGGK